MVGCREAGCGQDVKTLGLCGPHYDRALARRPADDPGQLRRAAQAQAHEQDYVQCCDRCLVQLGAYAADGGRGDRPLLAGTMTFAEAAAYMLGAYDRRSADGEDGIDPYIVERFHELRSG